MDEQKSTCEENDSEPTGKVFLFYFFVELHLWIRLFATATDFQLSNIMANKKRKNCMLCSLKAVALNPTED